MDFIEQRDRAIAAENAIVQEALDGFPLMGALEGLAIARQCKSLVQLEHAIDLSATEEAGARRWADKDGTLMADYIRQRACTACLRRLRDAIANGRILEEDEDEAAVPPPRYKCYPRGLGADTQRCFMCKGDPAQMYQTNFAAFVNSREDGDGILILFEQAGALAYLDYRPYEPKWIQVKVGACQEHQAHLEHLMRRIIAAENHIDLAMIQEAMDWKPGEVA